MEPKKIKKLGFRPETIANLSNFEQNRIVGGTGTRTYSPTVISALLGHQNCDCGGGGEPTNSCNCTPSVPLVVCPYPPQPQSGIPIGCTGVPGLC